MRNTWVLECMKCLGGIAETVGFFSWSFKNFTLFFF